MTEKDYENILKALGAKNITTNRQSNNGTTAYKLQTGQVIAEFESGYIRRNLYQENIFSHGRCYQLNPTYTTLYKVFTLNRERSYEGKARMKILDRTERLKRLVLYTIKKNNSNK